MQDYQEVTDVREFFSPYPYWSCSVFGFEYRPTEQVFQLVGTLLDFNVERGCRKFVDIQFTGVECFHKSVPKGYHSPYAASPHRYEQQPDERMVEVHDASTTTQKGKFKTVLEMTYLMGNITLVYERVFIKVKIGRGVKTQPDQWDYFDVATGQRFDFYRPFAG
ncbi:hypothetical protein [Hymenobacter sp. CRA2]|uniref:hypothetical protein n=1 Tax=Hymenobacter sp. CRA2 TaxID=1955620 RepID=UPI00098EDF71|nr:hypothetical protein [Hymenobacter sp. CRA2]OON67102.1 hypothetical protein B0919_19940 [Hymenobacter sp. CRA2]